MNIHINYIEIIGPCAVSPRSYSASHTPSFIAYAACWLPSTLRALPKRCHLFQIHILQMKGLRVVDTLHKDDRLCNSQLLQQLLLWLSASRTHHRPDHAGCEPSCRHILHKRVSSIRVKFCRIPKLPITILYSRLPSLQPYLNVMHAKQLTCIVKAPHIIDVRVQAGLRLLYGMQKGAALMCLLAAINLEASWNAHHAA